jgi:hypothetical protein
MMATCGSNSAITGYNPLLSVCCGFCLETVTALQVTSINLEQKVRRWKHILANHIITPSDLVSFLNEGNCLGDDTCAAMLGPQPV